MIADAQDSLATNPVTPKMDFISNVEATPNTPDIRTNQQGIQPAAVQNRFVNIIQQHPLSQDGESAVNQVVLDLGDGVASNDNIGNINFSFTGSTPDMANVQLATTIYIDEVAYDNAYPFGQNITVGNWVVERLKVAHHLDTKDQTYVVNQLNQDTEFLIIKNLTASPHRIFVFYYWRYILNSGGVKS